jgi:hypothetical protein
MVFRAQRMKMISIVKKKVASRVRISISWKVKSIPKIRATLDGLTSH